jgi:hypothetical protein
MLYSCAIMYSGSWDTCLPFASLLTTMIIKWPSTWAPMKHSMAKIVEHLSIGQKSGKSTYMAQN